MSLVSGITRFIVKIDPRPVGKQETVVRVSFVAQFMSTSLSYENA